MGGLFLLLLLPLCCFLLLGFSVIRYGFPCLAVPLSSVRISSSRFAFTVLRFCRRAAGAILSEPLTDPAAPKIEGSVLLASAETREEVVEQLRRDTYFTSGVWDWEKVVIYPVSGFMLCSEVGVWGLEGEGECLDVAGLG